MLRLCILLTIGRPLVSLCNVGLTMALLSPPVRLMTFLECTILTAVNEEV